MLNINSINFLNKRQRMASWIKNQDTTFVVYKKCISLAKTNIDTILGHKASLSKCKNVEIIHCILSDHRRIELELNSKRNYRKYSNTWRLNNTLLNDSWIIEEIKEEIQTFLKSNENENNLPEPLGCSKSRTEHLYKKYWTHK
jgi:hypothetical protein